MHLRDNPQAAATLEILAELGFIKAYEADAVCRLGAAESPFAADVALAETLHLHIKVDNTDELPLNTFFEAGARLDHQKNGFVKWRFPGAINAIFSHIKVSQEELLETESTRRPRPFLDHIGIDMRDETAPVREAFDALPDQADTLNWKLASQGGPGRPVYCCHVEVAEKHWLYPPGDADRPGIPLEFAYGALKVNPDKSGCDLRPADPGKVDPTALASVSCCGVSAGPSHGDTGHTLPMAEHGDTSSASRGGGGYYQPQDLARFGEIARVNPALGAGFFAYYEKAMADGLLSRREKALIALATAHTLKCPYCIDSCTASLHALGVSEGEMGEAVHVAAALAAGVTLVHSVQMMNKVAEIGATGGH